MRQVAAEERHRDRQRDDQDRDLAERRERARSPIAAGTVVEAPVEHPDQEREECEDHEGQQDEDDIVHAFIRRPPFSVDQASLDGFLTPTGSALMNP